MSVSGGRILGAAILGAIALQVWGAIWWMGLSTIIEPVGSLPPEVESALVDTALEQNIEDGAYFIPGVPVDDSEAAMNTWVEKQKAGPVGMVLYHSGGVTPLDPTLFVRAFVINFVACFLVCVVMIPGVRTGMGFGNKVAVAVCFGVVAALASYGNLWNWMHAPTDFAWKMGADVLGGWLLAGCAIAAVLKATADKPGVEVTRVETA